MKQDLHDVPLHKSVLEDLPQVFNLGDSVMNRQLTTTMEALANTSKRDKPQQRGGVYVGDGLTPLPTQLTKRIRSGEYTEREELQPEVCI